MLNRAIQFFTFYRGEIILLLKFILILIITRYAAKISYSVVENYFQRKKSKKMEINQLSVKLVKKVVGLLIYIIGISAAIYTVPELRTISITLFASAGFLGIVLGLAAQETISNLISGVLIAVYQPFRIGDNLTTGEKYGEVEDITMGHTIIKTPQNDRVIIPNSNIINESLINHSIRSKKSRFDVEIGISYESDIDTARELMMDEISKNEQAINEECRVFISEVGDSAIIMKAFIWGKTRGDAWEAARDLREAFKKRFTEEGIDIPYPHRTLTYKNGKKEEKKN